MTPWQRKHRANSTGLYDVIQMELSVDRRGQDEELAALARKARTGNAAAFDTLARRVYTRVRRWATGVTGDADDADDVAQQVLLKLHEHIDTFEGRSRFTTWLYRITRNLAYNRVHRDRHRNELLERHAPEMVDADSTTESRDEEAAKLAGLVRFYLQELPPRQREVFELSDLQGKNSTEVADALNISASTARGLLMKARRRIRLRMLEAHRDVLEEYTS